jgi:hypothetical protein
MIIRHQEGEVGVAGLKHELHLIVGDLVHLGDRGDDRFGSRFRPFGGVQFQRSDHIVSGERRAVVERDALPQIEGPGLGVGCRLPIGRQFADQFAIRGDFGQAIEHRAVRDDDHVGIGMGAPVPGVRRVRPGTTKTQCPATFRLCQKGHARQTQDAGGDPGLEQSASAECCHCRSPCFFHFSAHRTGLTTRQGSGDSRYILSTAASPMLSTPRSASRLFSQSGSISGTDDSKRSV